MKFLKKENIKKEYVIIFLSVAVCIVCVLNLIFSSLAGKNEPVFETEGSDGSEVKTSEDDSYFDNARYNRSQSRDKAVNTLKSIADDETYDEASRTQASMDITEYAQRTEQETRMESQILAKGYTDCIVLLGDDNASVVVQTSQSELTAEEATRIIEIVTSESGLSSDVVKIIELK